MRNKTIKLKLIKPQFVRHEAHFSLYQMLVVGFLFALLGTILLWRSFAATAVVTIEAETIIPPPGVSVVSDSAASGGKALWYFYNDVATTSTFSINGPASYMTVRAKANACSGSPYTNPQMDVTIDNRVVRSGYVSSLQWQDYTVPVSVSAGSHSLTIRRYVATNDKSSRSCKRTLSVDKLAITVNTADTNPVSATVTYPINGTTVSGSIPAEAKASSTAGSIARVEFYLDGALKKTENASPYCLAGDSGAAPCYGWDTKTVINGSHTLTAYAYDTVGNKSAASTVSFTVNNAVVQPTGNNVSLGTYMGPANVAGHDQFSAWLGWEAYVAEDFIDDSQTWDNIANNSNWLLDPWSQWVKAKPGRRMVIAMPMLNQASAGQLAQGANGAFDSYFRTLAQNMVNKGLGQSIIRLGWEANGDWYPWRASVDQASWKAYYRRIVGIMRSVQPTVTGQPAQAFKFDLNYNLGTSGTAVTFASLYPGDDVVDYIGLDAYDTKWMDLYATPDTRWNSLLYQPMGLNEFVSFAASHGKLMSLPEWGLWPAGTQNGGGGDDPYYIDRIADWIAANRPQIAYQSYFNHLSGGSDGDHRLSTYPNSQVRYLARFGVNSSTSSN